jgi:hypothetical protein
MPIFGDESGDPGMKPGSSPTFTLALILFESELEAAACEQTIASLKVSLHVDEFRWVNLDDSKRTAFLQTVVQHDFFYVAQTLVKKRLKHRDFRKKAFFYERVAEKSAVQIKDFLLLAQANCLPDPLNLSVVLDRNDDADYMRSMGKHLRSIKDARGKSLIGKVSSRRSHGQNLLQLADMVCGAVLHPPFDKIVKNKKWQDLTWP